MSAGGFKFDFSPPAVTEGDCVAAPAGNDEESRLTSEANELVATLAARCERNAGACTLVDASSRLLSDYSGGREGGKVDGGAFQPHLRFHPHETIDLHSSGMEGLRYVLPKHTLSDDSTDLIPGVYEGGLKVWECSVDLCRYLAGIVDGPSVGAPSNEDVNGECLREAVKRALGPTGSTMELGCGHGLPGCFVLRENIRRSFLSDARCKQNDAVILFADFNDFVLHHATIPNAQANVCGLRCENGVALDEVATARALVERSVFAGGDWMGLSYMLTNGKIRIPQQKDEGGNRLDLILAAETTYTPASCEDTAYLMLKHLKMDVGVGLVATKRFYFGVGGGTDLFIAAAEKLSRSDEGECAGLRLQVKCVQSYDTGNANIRDLLLVRCLRK